MKEFNLVIKARVHPPGLDKYIHLNYEMDDETAKDLLDIYGIDVNKVIEVEELMQTGRPLSFFYRKWLTTPPRWCINRPSIVHHRFYRRDR